MLKKLIDENNAKTCSSTFTGFIDYFTQDEYHTQFH